jgi:hypothetical protein
VRTPNIVRRTDRGRVSRHLTTTPMGSIATVASDAAVEWSTSAKLDRTPTANLRDDAAAERSSRVCPPRHSRPPSAKRSRSQMRHNNRRSSAIPHRTLVAGAQRVKNLFFPVTLTLKKHSIGPDGEEIPISNGMAVTVEIKQAIGASLTVCFRLSSSLLPRL